MQVGQDMHSLFVWLETSSFSVWVRESTSVFAFPTILSLHAIGMGMVAGTNAAIALRILGAAPRVPLLELKRFFPIIWLGFWVNAMSGVVLLIGYPTKALTNPVFYAKLGDVLEGKQRGPTPRVLKFVKHPDPLPEQARPRPGVDTSQIAGKRQILAGKRRPSEVRRRDIPAADVRD